MIHDVYEFAVIFPNWFSIINLTTLRTIFPKPISKLTLESLELVESFLWTELFTSKYCLKKSKFFRCYSYFDWRCENVRVLVLRVLNIIWCKQLKQCYKYFRTSSQIRVEKNIGQIFVDAFDGSFQLDRRSAGFNSDGVPSNLRVWSTHCKINPLSLLIFQNNE